MSCKCGAFRIALFQQLNGITILYRLLNRD